MSTATARPKVKHTTATELARAEKTASDELKAAVATIRAEISTLTADNIKKRKKIGDEIRSIMNDTTGRYGTDPKKEIEALMPLSRDGIRPMVRFAELYTDDDVDRLLSMKHPTTGEGVSWSHVVAITRVKDKAHALNMAEKAVTKGWSSKELVAEIIRDAGGPRSQGGRKPKRADTLHACVGDVRAASANWRNSAKQWLSSGGLRDLLADEKPTMKLAEVLREALDTVDNLAIEARAVSAELNALYVQVVSASTVTKIVDTNDTRER